MDRHEILQAMLCAGRNYSVGVQDLRALVLKILVLSVKYVSRRSLWDARFTRPDDFVDWNLVEALPTSKNVLGGCAEWLGLLGFCQWDDLCKHEGGIQTGHPPLHTLRRHMRECSLDTGDGGAWTLVCKVLVLTLVQGLSAMHALEVLTCGVYKRNTHTGCMELLAKQAEHLFTPGQYETTLQFVLEHCCVDAQSLEQTHALCQASLEDRKLSLKMSRMTVMEGRPRLRDRVTSVLRTEERKAQVDTQLDTWDSYTGFSYKHQFPPTLSEKVRSKLYFLASQTRWDWAKYVEAVLPSGGPICSRVAAHPVTQPDLPVILRVLEGLSMDGSAPFEKMTEFRKACFQSFPVTAVQRMTLSQVRPSRQGARRQQRHNHALRNQQEEQQSGMEEKYGGDGRHERDRVACRARRVLRRSRALFLLGSFLADPAAVCRVLPGARYMERGLETAGERDFGSDHSGRGGICREAPVRRRGCDALRGGELVRSTCAFFVDSSDIRARSRGRPLFMNSSDIRARPRRRPLFMNSSDIRARSRRHPFL